MLRDVKIYLGIFLIISGLGILSLIYVFNSNRSDQYKTHLKRYEVLKNKGLDQEADKVMVEIVAKKLPSYHSNNLWIKGSIFSSIAFLIGLFFTVKSIKKNLKQSVRHGNFT